MARSLNRLTIEQLDQLTDSQLDQLLLDSGSSSSSSSTPSSSSSTPSSSSSIPGSSSSTPGSSSSIIISSSSSGELLPFSIKLRPTFESNIVDGNRKCYRIQVEAYDAEGLDGYIFRYVQHRLDPLTNTAPVTFAGVCSWGDIEDYPVGAPRTADEPAVFRKSSFDILVDTAADAKAVWDTTVAETQMLLNAIVDGQTLESAPAVTLYGVGTSRITLLPFFQKDNRLSNYKGYRVRVDAYNAVGLDAYIFRYYQRDPDTLTGSVTSVLSGVCTSANMAALPISTPIGTDDVKMFRLRYFDIVVDRQATATAVWAAIQSDVQTLLSALGNSSELSLISESQLVGVAIG